MAISNSPDLRPSFGYSVITRIGTSPVSACAADLDGTILATAPLEVASFESVFSLDYGRRFPVDTYHSRWNGRGGMFGTIAKDVGLGVSGEVLKQQVRARFIELARNGIPYVPGAEGFLEECNARGIRVAIATSTDHVDMHFKAAKTGLYQHISAWASGYEVDKGKPNPDVFNLALWRLDVHPGRSFGIGDTEHDMEGLERAGVPIKVLVAGERGIAGRSTRADIIVKTPADLDSRFFNLLQRW